MAPTLPALLNPILVLLGLGLVIGTILGAIARAFRLETDPAVELINNILPQTQCGQCGYPGCRPYAEAIADGDAINKCPPGGEQTIGHLAALLNVQTLPLDAQYGIEAERKVAVIREAECIGCAKCIPACPVDAILGAPKFMHTVIASECTGCDLCVDPCPVDCIDMLPVNTVVFGKSFTPVIEQQHQACINCGLCIKECPVDILPHELYWACQGAELKKARSLKLMHCIECSKCNDVCPSRIPLVSFYQQAKWQLQLQQEDSSRAELAKKRYELHQRRMEKMSMVAEHRRLKRAELAKQDRQQVSTKKIQAALERAKARKASK